MSFAVVATATSIAGLILGVGWMFAGRVLLRRWGIEANVDGLLLGRRLGVVYFGIAIFLFLGRSAPPSDFRTAVSGGILVAMILLAIFGIMEFRARRAGSAILVSVALEIVLASGYAWVLYTQ